jgi:hypothetical protein
VLLLVMARERYRTPFGFQLIDSFQVTYLAARRAGPWGRAPGCPAACRGVVHFAAARPSGRPGRGGPRDGPGT